MIYSDKILEDIELVETVKCVIDRINGVKNDTE